MKSWQSFSTPFDPHTFLFALLSTASPAIIPHAESIRFFTANASSACPPHHRRTFGSLHIRRVLYFGRSGNFPLFRRRVRKSTPSRTIAFGSFAEDWLFAAVELVQFGTFFLLLLLQKKRRRKILAKRNATTPSFHENVGHLSHLVGQLPPIR